MFGMPLREGNETTLAEQTRKDSDDEDSKPTKPGQVVSVDQLVSPTPGLIAQMTGFLTTKRYRYATVRRSIQSTGVYLPQKTASAEETVEGNERLRHTPTARVKVENYHADNGIFKARGGRMQVGRTRNDVRSCKRAPPERYRGKKNSRTQELARAMLTHANARWSDTITANLWPYAIRNANDAVNHTPSMQDAARRSPIEIFSNSRWRPIPNIGSHSGARPMCSQTNSRATDLSTNGRNGRSRSLPGRSPQHGRNVALVMDRDTALVSPQFHVARCNIRYREERQDEIVGQLRRDLSRLRRS
ncbi:hypothetical protein MHU86_23875 [Fragilaria crotonensis]|nr:hypothetical protein MHU86_23875 [Fragilaria crotonensis]